MIHLLINLALAVSAGMLLFIVARALPRVSEESARRPAGASRLMSYLEKADAFVKRISERFLRKARVILMKLENVVGTKLTAYKKDGDSVSRRSNLKLEFSETVLDEEEGKEEKEVEKEEKKEGEE